MDNQEDLAKRYQWVVDMIKEMAPGADVKGEFIDVAPGYVISFGVNDKRRTAMRFTGRGDAFGITDEDTAKTVKKWVEGWMEKEAVRA